MRALPVAALPLCLLVSCTTSPTDRVVAVATPQGTSSPQPIPSSSPSPAAASPPPSPSTAPRARRCRTSDLGIAVGQYGAGLGNAGAVVTLTNDSATPCQVFGYLGLLRLDRHRRAMLTHLNRGSSMLFTDPGPHRVLLAPGRTASAGIGWVDNPGPSDPPNGCPASTYARITPPDETTAKIVSAPIAACYGATVYVTALVAGSSGLP